MRAIQRINHNAAICEDGAGRQLIALGRGIGFGDMPHEVDLDVVTRTFYGIDSKYLAFIDEVDPEVLEFSAQLADIATGQLSYELSPNLPITLADHIQFAIKRAREHMVVSLPLERDLEQLHPIEYRLGELAVRGIKKGSVRPGLTFRPVIFLRLHNGRPLSNLNPARGDASETGRVARLALPFHADLPANSPSPRRAPAS